MGFQDESTGTSSSSGLVDGVKIGIDATSQSGTILQSKENYSSGDELTPKARKPYTITKQRERWTEEEHTKFLEALRLYGRDWRRIEEHVGTKTAVQIRSHAQKFFSKVVKESSSSEAGPTKPIEIPPPRPKRKPMHPYPRKLVNSSKKRVLVLEKPERSSSPNMMVLEHESGSPTSVLSPIGSDTMGSASSSPQNGSQSPVSSIADANPGLPAEQEDGYRPSTSLADEEENGITSGSMTGQSLMDVFGSKSRASKEESDIAEASKIVTLKLFGRTVLVTNSDRPSANDSKDEEENLDEIDLKSVQTSQRNITQNESSADSSRTDCSYLPSGQSPVFCNMQLDKVNLSHERGASQCPQPQPWYVFYGGLPFPLMSSLNSNSVHTVPVMPSFGLSSTHMDVRVLQNKEESWTPLNNSSMTEVEMEERNTDGVGFVNVETYGHKDEKEPDLCLGLNLTEVPLSSKRRVSPLRGFVPYKRSPDMVGEARDGQRIRLCL